MELSVKYIYPFSANPNITIFIFLCTTVRSKCSLSVFPQITSYIKLPSFLRGPPPIPWLYSSSSNPSSGFQAYVFHCLWDFFIWMSCKYFKLRLFKPQLIISLCKVSFSVVMVWRHYGLVTQVCKTFILLRLECLHHESLGHFLGQDFDLIILRLSRE